MSRFLYVLMFSLLLSGGAHALTEAAPATPQQTDNLVDPDEKSEFGANTANDTSYPQNRTRSQYLLGEQADQARSDNSNHLGNFSFGFSQQAGSTYNNYRH